jgi:hypothetical protein
MSVALPNKLLFQTKVESAAARSMRTNIQPQNGTSNYGAGDTIIINIPTRNNLVAAFSESYLKFDAQFTCGAATNDYIRLDSAGAHGFIQRIRVFCGSNLLSDIENYANVAKMMMDIQVSSDAYYGKYSVMSGTRPDLTVKLPASGAAGGYSVNQTNNGYRFNDVTDPATGITTYAQMAAGLVTTKKTFSITLMSLVGSLCAEKYFPLFACTSAPLRVEIQLAASPNLVACTQSALSSFNITNCEYICQMIELSDSAMSTILNQSNGGPLQFVVSDLKNFSLSANGATSTSSTSQFTIPIAAKYSSLKSLFIIPRPSDKIGKTTFFPLTSNKFNIQEYSFRIGATVLPSKNPNNSTEMFCELMKAIGSIGDVMQQPSIDTYSYNQDYPIVSDETAAATGSTSSGSFYIGLDLENYSGADRSMLFSGYNSNTDDIYFNPTFGIQSNGSNAGNTIIRFESYAMFDSVMVFENNTCYAKF